MLLHVEREIERSRFQGGHLHWQVVPVIWAGQMNTSSNGRQLATPLPWPVPNLRSTQPANGAVQNSLLDAVYDPVTVIEGGRRLMGAGPRGGFASEQAAGGLRRRLMQGAPVNNVPTMPPGLQGAVFRPRPGFTSAFFCLPGFWRQSPCLNIVLWSSKFVAHICAQRDIPGFWRASLP